MRLRFGNAWLARISCVLAFTAVVVLLTLCMGSVVVAQEGKDGAVLQEEAPTGACCMPDGSCNISTEAACTGTYKGDS